MQSSLLTPYFLAVISKYRDFGGKERGFNIGVVDEKSNMPQRGDVVLTWLLEEEEGGGRMAIQSQAGTDRNLCYLQEMFRRTVTTLG